MIDDFENVVCAIEKSRNFEEMTIDDLESSLKAHEQQKKKKKQEVMEEALQTMMTTKEDKVMYEQHNQGRGQGYIGHDYSLNGDCGSGNTIKRGDK